MSRSAPAQIAGILMFTLMRPLKYVFLDGVFIDSSTVRRLHRYTTISDYYTKVI